MLKKVNSYDQNEDEKLKKFMEEKAKIGSSKKLLAYNNPKILILIGAIGSLLAGAS
jgi:hypothetical protein